MPITGKVKNCVTTHKYITIILYDVDMLGSCNKNDNYILTK